MSFTLTGPERRWLVILVVAIVGVRFTTLGLYPLMDSTESRYAEIARKMLETGEWLMPQFDYGVPFWGKPPLSIWLAAASMSTFGVNEFAARLPSLLLLAGCAALVYALARQRGGGDQALWTLALFAGTGIVFIAAGGVMTDPALMFGTTLSMAGFWIAVHGPEPWRRRAGFAFFAGLAVGMLAKGPIAPMLVFAPLFCATLWTRSWRRAWQRLPWIAGLAIAAGLTLAWYLPAEHASPGFLRYFFIGEHWDRFVEEGWRGDLYGATHPRPPGTIWLLWIGAALPWSIGTLLWIARSATRERARVRALSTDPWSQYLLLWALTPMLFFTFAQSVLLTYVLPGMPAFALLLGDAWRPMDAGGDRPRKVRPAVRWALVAGTVAPLLMIAALAGRLAIERSQEGLVRDFDSMRTSDASHLVYFPKRPHSAEFYSGGRALTATDPSTLRRYLDDAAAEFFAVRKIDLAGLPAEDRARLALVGSYGEYALLRRRR